MLEGFFLSKAFINIKYVHNKNFSSKKELTSKARVFHTQWLLVIYISNRYDEQKYIKHSNNGHNWRSYR